jgi:hypothetical protein
MSLYCQYCKQPAKLVPGDLVYAHRPDLANCWFWECQPCDARVGCHPGTTRNLGILAKPELRRLKSLVHASLDPLWHDGSKKRSEAYAWLADGLGIPRDECHVGMFTEDRCRAALAFIASQSDASVK